jgi:hypothetical protein
VPLDSAASHRPGSEVWDTWFRAIQANHRGPRLTSLELLETDRKEVGHKDSWADR